MAERFHYNYSDDELGQIAARTQGLATSTDEVHAVFNNSRDYAPRAAERLRRHLGEYTHKVARRLRPT